MLYFFIVLITMLIVIGTTLIVSSVTGSISTLYAIIAPMFVNIYMLVLMGVVCLVLRLFVPKKCWNAEKKIFIVDYKEVKFYEKLKIRKWKGLIPEKGATTGLAKDKIKSTELDYLKLFLSETCFAETMHWVIIVLSFSVLFIMPVADYYFTFVIIFVNAFLHLLPCFIQRYVRAKMLRVYLYRKNKQEIVKNNLIQK